MRKRRSAANDTEIADGKIWLRSWQPIQLCNFLAAQLDATDAELEAESAVRTA